MSSKLLGDNYFLFSCDICGGEITVYAMTWENAYFEVTRKGGGVYDKDGNDKEVRCPRHLKGEY